MDSHTTQSQIPPTFMSNTIAVALVVLVLFLGLHFCMSALLFFSITTQLRAVQDGISHTIEQSDLAARILNEKAPAIANLEQQSELSSKLLSDRTPIILDIQKQITNVTKLLTDRAPVIAVLQQQVDADTKLLLERNAAMDKLSALVEQDTLTINQRAPLIVNTAQKVDELSKAVDQLEKDVQPKKN
jgi:methyl-accepting chemotaxis protein